MSRTIAGMRRKGAALVVGGGVVAALSQVHGYGVEELPVSLGVVYLVAAAFAGRDSPLWSSAVLYTVFGSGVQLTKHHVVDRRLDATTVEILSIGLALGIGALLQRRRFAVDTMGLAVAVALVGVILAAGSLGASKVYDPLYYGLLLAAYGVYELRPRANPNRPVPAGRDQVEGRP